MGKYAQQGYDARIAGKPLDANPHQGEASSEWQIGWHMANVEEHSDSIEDAVACSTCID